METRLLRQHLSEKPAQQRRPAESRMQLADQMEAQWQSHAEQMARNPQLAMRAAAKETGPDMINRMQQVAQAYRDRIDGPDGIRGKVNSLHLSAGSMEEISAILDAIVTIPDFAAFEGDQPATHRYLRSYGCHTGGENSEKLIYCVTDFSRLEQDQNHIRTLSEVNPDLRSELTVIIQALDELKRADRRSAAFEWEKGNQSVTTKVFKQFGKTAAVSALALATLIMGAVGLFGKRKNMILKAFLPMGLGLFIANPAIRRMIFGGQLEQEMASVRSSLSRPVIDLMTAYDVQGEQWVSCAENIRDRESTAAEHIRKLINPTVVATMTQEQLDEGIRSLMPDDTPTGREARTQLERMIHEGRFSTFVQGMRAAQTQNTWETVRAFVQVGSAKTVQALQTLDTTQEAKVSAKTSQRPTSSPAA